MTIYQYYADDFVTCPDCGTRCDEHGLNEGQTQCPKCGKEFAFELTEEDDSEAENSSAPQAPSGKPRYLNKSTQSGCSLSLHP